MGAPVNHGRMKPKAAAPTAAERAHWSRVAALGCLVSGEPATLHHPTAWGDRRGRLAREHSLVVPLAPRFHLIQHGPRESVEALGHQGFYATYGICLRSVAEMLREESRAMGIEI